ncbi:MAG: amidase [Rhodobacterales bacterium]|nr:amidase [Rhodobacterales bacterium]
MTTAQDMGRALAAGQVTSLALTRTALDRAHDLQSLNAFITLLPETALDAARASDARHAGGHSLGPLDGIPLAVKDNIAVANVPTTGGTRAFAKRIAAADATVITRLCAAGGVIIGTLNMHEGALGATTDNPFWGRCDNPAAPGHTPGGSSGGSAAAIAAGIVPVTLGSDTMGSVRIPAAYCGLWGLKPTRGLIPVTGLSHLSWTLDSIGPLATNGADIALLTAILAGQDESDPDSLPLPPGWTATSPRPDLARINLGLPDDTLLSGCTPPVRAAFDALVARARRAGVNFRPFPAWDTGKLRRDGLLLSEAECGHLIGAALDTTPKGFSDTFRSAIAYGLSAPGSRIAAAYRTLNLAAHDARRAMEGLDALLLPTAPQQPFPHGTPAPANQADFTALANIAGLPAVAFPLPDDGLPLSAQLIGPAFSEGRLIALAQSLTEAP